jgi:hypothetical protein
MKGIWSEWLWKKEDSALIPSGVELSLMSSLSPHLAPAQTLETLEGDMFWTQDMSQPPSPSLFPSLDIVDWDSLPLSTPVLSGVGSPVGV